MADISKKAAHQLVNLLQELVGYIDMDTCHQVGDHNVQSTRCTLAEQKSCVRKLTDYTNSQMEPSS